jgi:hypothetical protein
MKLDDEWTLESDSYQFILLYLDERGINKYGNKTVRPLATYHSNLEKALLWYIQNCAKPCKSAKDILNKLEEVKSSLKSMSFERYSPRRPRELPVEPLSHVR